MLAFVGVALFLGGLKLYPSTNEPPTPPYANLGISSTFPIGYILYSVDQVSPSIAKIKVVTELPVGAPKPTAAAQLVMAPPIGTRFETCPIPACQFTPHSEISVWQKPLSFTKTGNTVEAVDYFFVKARDFGDTYNGVTAAAAIPSVVYKGPGMPTFYTQYRIPSASSYDWSTFPTQFANGTFASWAEPVTNGETSGKAAVGIDHANQATADNHTFLAGALIGLAGGALLSAIQEALHAND
jgi:hypothetical protein